MKTIVELAKEFHDCFPEIKGVNGTLTGCLHDAMEAGRKQAMQFAVESNRATIKVLEGTNKIKTPYVTGAINALTESCRDWEDILSGNKVPEWPNG